MARWSVCVRDELSLPHEASRHHLHDFFVFAGHTVVHAEDLRFNDKFIAAMPERVRQILRAYDPPAGHFSSTVWECRAQNLMYLLAVAYTTPGQSRY